jgi:hypothetical protein
VDKGLQVDCMEHDGIIPRVLGDDFTIWVRQLIN